MDDGIKTMQPRNQGAGRAAGAQLLCHGAAGRGGRGLDYESQDQTKPIPCHVGATFTLRGMG